MLWLQTWADRGWQGNKIPPLQDFIVNSQKTHFIPQASQKVCKNLQLERQFGPAAVIAASEAEQDEPLSFSSPLDLSFAHFIISGTAAPENALMMMLPAAAG